MATVNPTRFLETTHRTVKWFQKADDDGELTLTPTFQRNAVWTDAQRSYLIDSIINGYPVPELYMQDSVDDTGDEAFLVVDGQQRIRACLDFVRGKLELTGKDVGDRKGQTIDTITGTERKRLYGYKFVVRQLPELPDAELRDIFRRLNRNNVALNDQELRHAAYSGTFIRTLEGIATWSEWDSVPVFTTNDVRRMLDVEFISELAVAVLHGPQEKKKTLDEYYDTYAPRFPFKTRIVKTFKAVLGEIGHLVPNRKSRLYKKSDFYSLFLVLAEKSAEFPLSAAARKRIASRLARFATDVDRAREQRKKTGPPADDDAGNDTYLYESAVSGAASDLSRRRSRVEILTRIIKGAEEA